MKTQQFTLTIFARILRQKRHYTMALPNKYQNGSIDSTTKGVYRASPIKLMIYGNGEHTPSIFSTGLIINARNK